ncbi:MAG: hypothetical protein MJ238_01720 [Bacilli bacterium]|nr:hypothetical protein [Bacilli bacterium]
MSEIKTVHRCSSCGAILQSQDKALEGYIDAVVLKGKSLNDIVFCDDCYKKAHYSPFPNTVHADKSLITVLKDARASDALVVYFIDLFSFEYSIPVEAANYLSRQNVLVVARLKYTKKQITIPEQYVSNIFKTYRINIKPEDVIITDLSATSIPEVKEEINKRRKAHDVYLIGSTLSPVNTFAKRFLNDYVNVSTSAVVTKKYKGTDLDVMRIPLDNSSKVYCIPPFEENNSYYTLGNDNFRKIITPDSKAGIRKKTLKPGKSMMIGELVRIDFLEGKTAKVDAFFAEEGDGEVMSTRRCDEHFAEMLEKHPHRPYLPELKSSRDFDAFEITIDEEGYRDVGISGLGWISFKGEGQKLRIYVKIGIGVYGSEAKVNQHVNTKTKGKA